MPARHGDAGLVGGGVGAAEEGCAVAVGAAWLLGGQGAPLGGGRALDGDVGAVALEGVAACVERGRGGGAAHAKQHKGKDEGVSGHGVLLVSVALVDVQRVYG